MNDTKKDGKAEAFEVPGLDEVKENDVVNNIGDGKKLVFVELENGTVGFKVTGGKKRNSKQSKELKDEIELYKDENQKLTDEVGQLTAVVNGVKEIEKLSSKSKNTEGTMCPINKDEITVSRIRKVNGKHVEAKFDAHLGSTLIRNVRRIIDKNDSSKRFISEPHMLVNGNWYENVLISKEHKAILNELVGKALPGLPDATAPVQTPVQQPVQQVLPNTNTAQPVTPQNDALNQAFKEGDVIAEAGKIANTVNDGIYSSCSHILGQQVIKLVGGKVRAVDIAGIRYLQQNPDKAYNGQLSEGAAFVRSNPGNRLIWIIKDKLIGEIRNGVCTKLLPKAPKPVQTQAPAVSK